MIWDRRTAVTPLRENQYQQKIEIEKIKTALKEMGESDKKIAEILNRASLL
jgi:phage gp16-like protein